MSFEWRGGIPRVRRETVDTTGRAYPFDPPGTSKWVRLRNLSAAALEVVRVYFTQADFDANTDGYMELRAGDIIREPLEAERLWLRSQSGTPTVEITVLHRRG